MVAAANSVTNTYEDARNKRLEENKRKFQDLGILKTLSDLTTSSPSKTQQRVSKPKSKNTCLDVEPRRSTRQRNPVPSYHDDEVDIGFPTLRKRSRSTSSPWGSYLARPIEEVRLVSYEERSAAFKAAEKLQQNLEAGNPSFVKSMGLPSKFCEDYLSKMGSEMVLEDEDGKEFDAVYIHKRSGLSGGWRGFALDHRLDDGDALVFELTEPARFKIYIVKVSPRSSLRQSKNIVDKENMTEMKPDSESNQKRRSKRGTVPAMDDSKTSPKSESNQIRRSKRGIVPAIDDSKTSPDSESNQKRRSRRGTVPVMDDSKPSQDLESHQLRRSKRGIVLEMDDSKTCPNSESSQKGRSKRGTVPVIDDSKPSQDLESHQIRRSKRGIVLEMNDSKTSPDSESNKKRRSKRGSVPVMDADSKPSQDWESNQLRRSKRGIVLEMDDSKSSPKLLLSESPEGCEMEQEVIPLKMNGIVPKQIRKKANRVLNSQSAEAEVEPEVKHEVSATEEKTRDKDEKECAAVKPARKPRKERLFRKRA